MRYPCNTGFFSYRYNDGRNNRQGSFRPSAGSIREHGSDNKRVGWASQEGTYSALILVGLESPSGRSYDVEDVVDIVKRVRDRQTGDPSASLISQRGLYKHKEGGQVVEEDSVRIIILHLTDETKQAFREHIVELAETLARQLQQEEVIVEFQNRGVTDEVMGITP